MTLKIIKTAGHHKFLAGLIVAVIIGGGILAYTEFKPDVSEIKYNTTTVQQGTLATTISGSGQVSSSNQVDLTPKTSGNLVYVGITKGQEIKAGALIVQLDAGDALKTVRDAEMNLASARLSLTKLTQPADSLSILQAKNSLANAEESKQQAKNSLAKAYEDSYNAVADAFLELPSIMSGLDDILYSYDITDSQANSLPTDNRSALLNAVANSDYNERSALEEYLDNAEASYAAARTAYSANALNYNVSSRASAKEAIESLLDETLNTAKLIADAIKKINNMLDYWVDYRTIRNKSVFSQVTQYQNNLAGYTSQANGHVSSLLLLQNSMENYQQAIIDADRTIAEKTESYNQLLAGADQLDIESQQITIRQRENSLADAKESLADYYIRAPFDGIVADVGVKKGDQISSGTVIASLISKQQLAEITLNEVDVAKVKIGQKVTLTFDAVDGLDISGQVAEIDLLGAVTSGVVNYGVTIAFDTQDERIKPGMSVATTIITDIRQDVLIVPNAAVKTQNSQPYVEIMNNGNPQAQPVEVGLVSDVSSEIISGLNEGDEVVTQTITNNNSSASSAAGSSISGDSPNNMQIMRMMPHD